MADKATIDALTQALMERDYEAAEDSDGLISFYSLLTQEQQRSLAADIVHRMAVKGFKFSVNP